MRLISNGNLKFNSGSQDRLNELVEGKITRIEFDPESQQFNVDYAFKRETGEIIESGTKQLDKATVDSVLATAAGDLPGGLSESDALSQKFYLGLRVLMVNVFKPLNSTLSKDDITLDLEV